MSNNDAENFAEIMNRIARVPVSSVPPRKPKDTSKPAPEKKETDDNKPSSDKEWNLFNQLILK